MTETHARSLAKALTYRAVGSLATGLIAWWFSGSLRVGAAVGVADTVIKLALYYVHERLWHLVPWGRRPEIVEGGGGI